MSHPTSKAQGMSLFVRALQTVATLRPGGKSALAALPMRVIETGEGYNFLHEGQRTTESCIVLSGLVGRYKIVSAGQRQILSFHFPGEAPDLQSLHLDHVDHSLCALTPATVGFVTHAALQDAADRHRDVERALLRWILVDAAVLREWIANIGRRGAHQRMAHLLCELSERMVALQLAEMPDFLLPLTQAALGDALGISTVHVNRTLQQLRRDGLIESSGRTIHVKNWPDLRRAGDFDPAYLHLRRSEDDPA